MNALAVSIAVILFPGLIATVICDKIAVHSARWRAFKYAVYSFIFGVLAYLAVQVVYWAWGIISDQPTGPLDVWSMATAQQSDINLWEVFWASLLSPLIAAIATLIHRRQWLTRFAQWAKISNKYGDENLLSYFLNSPEVQYVYIRDPNINQTYCGRVWQYSETDHIQEVVLADVTVYEYECSTKLYTLPSIYLARPTGTFVIEQASYLEGRET